MARSGKYQPRPQPGPDDASSASRTADKAARREAARIEMMRAQAAADRRRRLRSVLVVLVAIVAIVAVVAVVELTRSSNPSTPAASGASSTPIDPQVEKAVSSVPASVFDAVGAGSVQAKPKAISAPALTRDNKPRVLYVGAEYCPFCAAERWPVVVALSRFGTFKNLGQTTSSARDVYPSTPTLSFHGSTYTSPYLSFTGVEQTTNQPQGNGYVPLDTLTPEDQKILDTYDTQQYTGASDGSIPFMALGGKFASAGASYDPGVLKGLTHQQIAQDLSDPNSPVAKAVIGTANTLTADLCQLTGQQPASVCTSAGVRAAAS